MNTELMTTESNLPTTHIAMNNQVILKDDILLPRLLLMQGLSDFVTERQKDTLTGRLISQGDMVKSLSLEVVGNPETPVEIIPLFYDNQWAIMKKTGQRAEFVKMNPRDYGVQDHLKSELDKTSDKLPFEFQYLGELYTRVKVMRLYALLAQDVTNFQKELEECEKTGEMPDMNKAIMPVQIMFRSTSFNAGKKVATHFALAEQMASYSTKVAAPYSYTLLLKTNQEKNDKGAYYVFDIGKGRKTTPLEFKEATKWANTALSSVKVDDSSDELSSPSVNHSQSVC